MNRKIIFAVPTNDRIEPGTTLAIAGICRREDIEYQAIMGSPTDLVRNSMVRRLLKDSEATHLLMMDSDILPPDNVVDLMLECDSPMSAAIVPIMLAGKIVSNIVENDRFMMHWEDRTEPFEVDGAGAGMILIRREVFETIPWPWFRYEEEESSGKRCGEDLYFSNKASKYGFKYKVHPKSTCDHIKKIKLLDIVKMYNYIRNDVLAESQEKEKELVAHG